MGNKAAARISRQPQSQPDFGAHFHTDSDTPVCYETRPPSGNREHDLIYISSYVHDSRFRFDELRWRGRLLTIPLNRAPLGAI
jgi:hypothetical protein